MRMVWLVSVVVAVLGCDQHVTRRTRTARVVAMTGVVVATVGGVATAGCFDVSPSGTACISNSSTGEACASPDGCRGGPNSADLALGLPLMVIGAGMAVGALLTRPKSKRRSVRGELPGESVLVIADR
jgi:hypothetical protein